MSNILVTGATGYVGQALLDDLITTHHNVVAAVRSSPEKIKADRVVLIDDIGPGTDWSGHLQGIDVIIHLAARVHMMSDNASDPLFENRKINLDGTVQLARAACNAGVSRFIFTSTIKVNGEATPPQTPFDEHSPPNPNNPYGQSKWEAEQALIDICSSSKMEYCILRPPIVYGPKIKGNFQSLLGLCQKNPPLPLASIKNKRSLIYVKNLTNAIIACLENPQAANQLFLVSDEDDLSVPELITKICLAFGQKPKLFPFPAILLKFLGIITRKSNSIQRLLDSLCLNSQKIQTQLKWHPPFTVEEGLQATAKAYLQSNDRSD